MGIFLGYLGEPHVITHVAHWVLEGVSPSTVRWARREEDVEESV